MIVAMIAILAAAANPPSTDEKFSVGQQELEGPCGLKPEGEPSDKPSAACASAIAAAATAKEKAILYFAWAYSLNEADAALEALANLDKALALAPNFTNALHERSYSLNDLGYYDRALIDSNRDVELSPQSADAYRERAYARHRLADFEGAVADRRKVLEIAGDDRDSEIGLVQELMWVGAYDETSRRLAALQPGDDDKELRAELERRLQLKPDGGEAMRCDLRRSIDDRATARKIVDDCSWAFDHETSPAKRATFLTVRRVASVVALQDRDAGVSDLAIAVALDPDNPERRINYGNALIGVGHSWAARNEFEAALAAPGLTNRDKGYALAGRGRARAILGDLAGAFGDAKESFEIEPSEANMQLLGDLAFQKGDREGAKAFWMGAYHLGARDDSLLTSLKSVGVEDPQKEPR